MGFRIHAKLDWPPPNRLTRFFPKSRYVFSLCAFKGKPFPKNKTKGQAPLETGNLFVIHKLPSGEGWLPSKTENEAINGILLVEVPMNSMFGGVGTSYFPTSWGYTGANLHGRPLGAHHLGEETCPPTTFEVVLY